MKHNQKPTEADMEAVALEVAETPLDEAGEPQTPLLDLDVIKKEHPNFQWVDVPFAGKTHAVKVLKGDLIDFIDSLDDADLLALEELTNDDETVSTADLPLIEQARLSRSNKTYQSFVLKKFILSPIITDANIDAIPKELKRGMMQAYDHVNGISTTKKVVDSLKKK